MESNQHNGSLLNCAHPQTRLRKYTCANSAVQYVHQCLVCGRRVGEAVPHRIAIAQNVTEAFDIWLVKDAEKRMHIELDQRRIASEELRAEQNAEFWRKYDAHVTAMSPRWRELRRLVMDRCQGICEGCGKSQATQVHHRTYEHLGDEFLWELHGVCNECHERVHGRKAG